MPEWVVELAIDGPVSYKGPTRFTQQKGYRPEDPFYSEIGLRPATGGIDASVTARAPNKELAFRAAVLFVGQMLDVVSWKYDLALYVGLTEGTRRRREGYEIRRVLRANEVREAFREARSLSVDHPTLLRSLSWYRKGLYSDDPFDAFLAFWNSIETVAAEYYRHLDNVDLQRAGNGSKSQIWECFKSIWGPVADWPIISGDTDWIDQNYETRIKVAHGVAAVDVDAVSEVVWKIETIRSVSCRFLRDLAKRVWEDTQPHE